MKISRASFSVAVIELFPFFFGRTLFNFSIEVKCSTFKNVDTRAIQEVNSSNCSFLAMNSLLLLCKINFERLLQTLISIIAKSLSGFVRNVRFGNLINRMSILVYTTVMR